MKRPLIAVLAVLIVTAAAPAARSQAARHPYTIPHVLRYATGDDIAGLNPHLVSTLTLSYLSSLTMAWLVRSGPDNGPVPELALEVPTLQNHLISPDGKTITYRLRRGVKWSDGAPFDADDVAFSIKTVQNPANNEVGRDGWDLISKVDEPDKYTIVLHLTKRYASYAFTFFSTLGANPCILPKHLLAGVATINDIPYDRLPIGIGPFRYTAWRRGDSVELEANPLYFRGRPKLDRIVFKVVPSRNTVITQLETHELDMWLQATAAYYARAKAIPGDAVIRQPSFAYDHLDFNLTHPGVSDPAVREALRYAVDRESIREKIHFGLAPVSDNVLGPGHPDYHAIPLTPFDLAKAKAILDAAGWKPGPDGIRAKDGVRLSLVYALASGSADADGIVELIRQTWQQLGVAIDVRHYPPPLLFAVTSDGILASGKFDVAMYAWNLGIDGDLSGQFSCAMTPPNGQNYLRWCDPKAEQAMQAFKLEYDAAKRKPYDFIVTDRIASQVPTIVLDIRDFIVAYNNDLKNFHPNAVSPFDDIMNVDI